MLAPSEAEAVIKGYEPMGALKGKDYGKSRMTYSDYTSTESGLQYQDLVVGTGVQATQGSTAVVDWRGVTIGYYGSFNFTSFFFWCNVPLEMRQFRFFIT